jgi:hypothetical protein
LRKPFIVFPSHLLDVVSTAELDQILLHEYGHVQRRDDWARLVQTMLQAALWLHPAARWIGSELNLEREVACDDWVVSRTGAARTYAGCLSRILENRRGSTDTVLIPALFGRTPDVLKRVERLLNPRRTVTPNLSFAACGVAVCIIAASAANLRAVPLIAEINVTVPTPRAAGVGIEASSISAPMPVPDVVLPVRLARTPPAAKTTSATTRTPAPTRSDAIPTPTPAPTPAPTTIATMSAPATHTDAISIIDSQPFHAVLMSLPEASGVQDTRNGWQITGMTIGTVAQKLSVSLAGSVAKTSVSIAKSF